QERAADDAARVQDALDLDFLGLGVAGVLEQIILFHFAAQVEQRQRPGRKHGVGEKTDGVRKIGVERGGGDQQQERDDVKLQIIFRGAPIEELVDEQEHEQVHARGQQRAVGAQKLREHP